MITSFESDPKKPVRQKTNRRDYATEQIKHYIRSRSLQPGDLLPPVRALSEHFKTSRDATWRALQVLQKEHWIRAKSNRRYEIAEEIYTKIIKSLRIRALFSGDQYISFSGFRPLADALKRECGHHNLDLEISLIPFEDVPLASIWDDCDVVMVDSSTSSKLLANYDDFPMPVVGLDADYSDRYRANIVTDHHMGGRVAAEHQIRVGCKEVWLPYFRGSKKNPRVKARIDGFKQAWAEAGRSEGTCVTVPHEWSQSSFEVTLTVLEHLKKHKSMRDLFVTDGGLAINYLEILNYLNVPVPGKVKLIGYDGAQMGTLSNPPMTTIQQDMDKIAQTAISRIVDFAQSPDSTNELIRIAPILTKRDSC